jgi:CheY-like chemotaxis protein
VAKTLLAVDDSVTMRKVLEITFSGEDFHVITAEGHKDALVKLGEDPAVCVIDTVLNGEDGYALAKEVRKRNPNATIVMMASRHNAYDPAKGKDAGADDFMDKPFDTQQMIDKVRKAANARDGVSPTAAATSVGAVKTGVAAAAKGAVPPIEQRSTQPSLGGAAAGTRQRAATLMFGHEPSTGDLKVVDAPASKPPEPVAAAPAQTSPSAVRRPTPMPVSNVPPATVAATPAALHSVASPAAAVTAGVNGAMAGKLEGLGLTAAQADAVLALSREVVERVVWEVVPVLAEALIKEEIARLTKEG